MASSKHIALRWYLDPFSATDLSIAPDRMGWNSGNLIFSAAAQRLIDAPGTHLTTMSMDDMLGDPDRINATVEHVVIPLANAFRPGFVVALARLTEFVEKLTVPITILGVGAQGTIDYRSHPHAEVDALARRFAAAVLERGPSIGVRGQFTADYLAGLGFSDTTVVGCPSMFLHGPDLPLTPPTGTPMPNTPMAINLDPSVTQPTAWLRALAQTHPDLLFVAQTKADLKMMLGGRAVAGAGTEYPSDLSHPFLAEDRARIFMHAATWIEAMRHRSFTFGHRIHGNVAALLAGVPAHVIAHDSRTRELAEYFEIPHSLSRTITSDTTAVDLFERSDWSRTVSGHRGRAATMGAYLDQHGVPHTAQIASGETDFDRRFADQEPLDTEVIIGPRSTDPASLSFRLGAAKELQQHAVGLKHQADGLKRQVSVLKQSRPEAPPVVRRRRWWPDRAR